MARQKKVSMKLVDPRVAALEVKVADMSGRLAALESRCIVERSERAALLQANREIIEARQRLQAARLHEPWWRRWRSDSRIRQAQAGYQAALAKVARVVLEQTPQRTITRMPMTLMENYTAGSGTAYSIITDWDYLR